MELIKFADLVGRKAVIAQTKVIEVLDPLTVTVTAVMGNQVECTDDKGNVLRIAFRDLNLVVGDGTEADLTKAIEAADLKIAEASSAPRIRPIRQAKGGVDVAPAASVDPAHVKEIKP